MISDAYLAHLLRMAEIYRKHDMPEKAREAEAYHATLGELQDEARREEVGVMRPSG